VKILKNAGATSASDQALLEVRWIQSAIAGEAEAFARLYETYVDQVYRFIFYRVGDDQTAEDLTSQVFFKAWDSLDRYQLRGLPFGAWLLRIARNAVIDHYRTFKETTPLEPTAVAWPDPAANVDQEVERRLEAAWLRSVLRQLTEDQRQVLTLRFIEGLSTQEVAQVMGKREGAIRALQMRGLQALAQMMGSDDE
jgi:RNA polymerase sigma-70 factor (ECF subfamily)